METDTPIDHKRIQGIIVIAIGFLISRYTDWEITTDQLTMGIGEIMYVLGLLWNMYGGLVAQGPIKWFSEKVKVCLLYTSDAADE